MSLVEVVTRVLRLKFYLASETSGFLLSLMIFFALPLVTRERQHISVKFLVGMLSVTMRSVIEILGELVMLAYCGVLVALCSTIVADAWANGIRAEGILRISVFYPFCGIVVGLVLLWLSQAGHTFRLVLDLLRDPAARTSSGA